MSDMTLANFSNLLLTPTYLGYGQSDQFCSSAGNTRSRISRRLSLLQMSTATADLRSAIATSETRELCLDHHRT
jgi:predicted alpha/beta-hydrolase family hydrolase